MMPPPSVGKVTRLSLEPHDIFHIMEVGAGRRVLHLLCALKLP